MNSKEIASLLDLQRKCGLVKHDGPDKGSDLFNWVLSGVYHKPQLKVEEIFTKIMLHWIPPPAKVLDPTAGPMKMHSLLVKGGGYEWVFGDIDPQVDGVELMDATALPEKFYGLFNAVVFDPPYCKNLSSEKKAWVKNYRGDRNFDLHHFFKAAASGAMRVLKPSGKAIMKIGDNHRKQGDETVFEPWHIEAVDAFQAEGFVFRDQVIFQPWYVPRWAPRRRCSMQRHSYFLLFEKSGC